MGHVVAHGCPIRSDLYLTCKHVVRRYTYTQIEKREPCWSNGYAEDGRSVVVRWDVDRDLVFMRATDPLGDLKPLSAHYEIADDMPLIGSSVTILDYDQRWGSTVKGFHVTRNDSGHLMYNGATGSKAPLPGSSGSCIWNDEMQVVGIHCGMG
jgi:hypothetical protein